MIERALVCAALLAASFHAQAQDKVPAAIAFAAVPELMAPGIVSTALHDFAPSLTPDGKTLLYTVTDSGFTRMTLMQSSLVQGAWQAATVLPFSGHWNDGDGVLSPDGKTYVFISNRPEQGDVPKTDLDLWVVSRKDEGGWGEPQRLPAHINSSVNEVYPSIAADGTLYFGRAGADSPIFRSVLKDGQYQAPERLPFGGFSFAVAPDQSYAIVGKVDANRNADLHLVRRVNGNWGAPVRLDGAVNTPAAEFASAIHGPSNTLLFVSARRPAAESWPRARPVRTAADVAAELNGNALNGLRNIYRVDLKALTSN
ncbi:MAG TPA: hypothetical protein VIT92_17280 [Burkholderiaceae bacterium]